MSWIVVLVGVVLIGFALLPFLFLPSSASLKDRSREARRRSDVPAGQRRN